MFDFSKCEICSFNVCGLGSESCSAVIGDYCPGAGEYIEETEEDKKLLDKLVKV